MACDMRAESSSHQACPKPPAQCVEHAEMHVDQRENLFSWPSHYAEHEHLRTQLPAQEKRMLRYTWMRLGGRRRAMADCGGRGEFGGGEFHIERNLIQKLRV